MKKHSLVCFERNFFQNLYVLGGHRYPKMAPLAQNLETKSFFAQKRISTVIPGIKPQDRHQNHTTISIGCRVMTLRG